MKQCTDCFYFCRATSLCAHGSPQIKKGDIWQPINEMCWTDAFRTPRWQRWLLPAVVVITAVALAVIWMTGCSFVAADAPPADCATLSLPSTEISPGEPLVAAVAACRACQIEVELSAYGQSYYWPTWGAGPVTVPVRSGSYPEVLWPVSVTVPMGAPDTEAQLVLRVYDLSGVFLGDQIRDIRIVADSATPTPSVTPRPSPTPGGCPRGSAIVRVSDIPIMTGQNKDEYNKDLLFCLRDEDNSNFVGVFHRYLQPDWPHGDWWPTWRIEAGCSGMVDEWHVFQSHDLAGDSAEFSISWDGAHVEVMHLGTGDTQALELRCSLRIDRLGEDAECSQWGWDSPADARLMAWDCGGSPPDGPWVSGSATFDVTGAEQRPEGDQEKGAILSLLGPGGQWALVRHRSRKAYDADDAPLLPGGWWQLKGTSGNDAPAQCWSEINYWQSSPADDGIWNVSWGIDDGDSWLTVTDPSGDAQTIAFSYAMAWADARAGECPGCRGSGQFMGTCELAEWSPEQSGKSGECE